MRRNGDVIDFRPGKRRLDRALDAAEAEQRDMTQKVKGALAKLGATEEYIEALAVDLAADLVFQMDYPSFRAQLQVIEDSDDGTFLVAARSVMGLQRLVNIMESIRHPESDWAGGPPPLLEETPDKAVFHADKRGLLIVAQTILTEW